MEVRGPASFSWPRRPSFTDSLPDTIGCRRHVDAADPISHRIHYRLERAGAACFAAALDSKWVGLRRHRVVLDRERGDIAGARQAIIHVRADRLADAEFGDCPVIWIVLEVHRFLEDTRRCPPA